jgi:endonuclease/exonuclease/phosphatase family metal-dependent hydrolase
VDGALARKAKKGEDILSEDVFVGRVDAGFGRRARLLGIALLLSGIAAGLLWSPVDARAADNVNVRVMTRNLYLGADLSPAISASSTNEFVVANGQIVRDVGTNNFPVRAKGLAQEILSKSPDLVGLQEVALWRKGPLNDSAPFTCNGVPDEDSPFGCDFTASTVRYDFLKDLLTQLNQDKQRYRVVISQKEFDFEAPTDYNGVAGDGDACPAQCDGEENDRLTMRDVILARTDRVTTTNVKAGHFEHLYAPKIAGTLTVHVLRGWTQADVTVRNSHKFRFVNTHLEAFGDPTIRRDQARELVQPGGPATGKAPAILIGDLNSDDNTVQGGDRLAYFVLLNHGFRSRSTENPLSCCLDSDIITVNGGGSVSDFDHHVDHILTNAPQAVGLVYSSVTGRQPVNGFWDSDHAGVFSNLLVH